jgi:hypothetical protein
MKRRRAIPDQVVTQENRSGLIGEGSENASSPGIVKLDTIDGGNDVDTNGRDADLKGGPWRRKIGFSQVARSVAVSDLGSIGSHQVKPASRPWCASRSRDPSNAA